MALEARWVFLDRAAFGMSVVSRPKSDWLHLTIGDNIQRDLQIVKRFIGQPFAGIIQNQVAFDQAHTRRML
jgi:hypothetical protein